MTEACVLETCEQNYYPISPPVVAARPNDPMLTQK